MKNGNHNILNKSCYLSDVKLYGFSCILLIFFFYFQSLTNRWWRLLCWAWVWFWTHTCPGLFWQWLCFHRGIRLHRRSPTTNWFRRDAREKSSTQWVDPTSFRGQKKKINKKYLITHYLYSIYYLARSNSIFNWFYTGNFENITRKMKI